MLCLFLMASPSFFFSLSYQLHSLVISVFGLGSVKDNTAPVWEIIHHRPILASKQTNKLSTDRQTDRQAGWCVKFKTTPSSSRSSTVLIDSLLVRAAVERKLRHNITAEELEKKLDFLLTPGGVVVLSVLNVSAAHKKTNADYHAEYELQFAFGSFYSWRQCPCAYKTCSALMPFH